MLTSKSWLGKCLALEIALATWLTILAAQPPTNNQFEANEAIESLRVELNVAAGGEDLDEPVALDLGLGFPLWLHRLGRDDSSTVPFGAVAQTGIESIAITAGQRASFEFQGGQSTVAAGLDELRTTPQLLAGVRVSDISRIGFTSKADHGWILEGYTIQINGKPFFKNDAVNVNGRACQDQARERLMELNREPDVEATELQELSALVSAGLATQSDRVRLDELQASLSPKFDERKRLERQLRGAAPFFEETGFESAWRKNGTIEKVKVTVVTAPHSAANTRNYVYFRTGGHKYLLGSALQPLSPELGPQEFTLDLKTTPLMASDLRGFALGVLAPHLPLGDTPDRWHPQRLRVEVDNRVVYDSEDNLLDSSSLSAIRLIPPAHRNLADQVVVNAPIAREAFVWEAGSGAGLDLVHGGADPLPEESDPTFPQAEPGVVINQDIDVQSQSQEYWYDPFAAPFPGEVGFGPGWQSGWMPGGGWLPDWRSGWNDGWGFGCEVGPGWLDVLVFGAGNLPSTLPDWVLPDPVGQPPQLEHVSVDYGTQTIHWTVSGDESQIDHFVVDRVLIRPDLDVPITAILGDPYPVPAGQRSLPWSELPTVMPMTTADEASRTYMCYRVTMIPTDPALGVDPGMAAAAPVSPMLPLADFHVRDEYEYIPVGGLPQHLPLLAGGEPELAGAAAWRAGESVTHNGLHLAGLNPLQHHIVARPQSSGDQTTIEVIGHLPPGHYRFITYVGFVGAVQQHVAAHLSSSVHVQSLADPTLHIGFPAGVAALQADPSLAPTPLIPVIHDIDTSSVGPGPMSFRAVYTFHHSVADPEHPPALFGLRLLEM